MGGDGDACGAPLLLFLFFTRKYLKARAAELGNLSSGLVLVRGRRVEAVSNGCNIKPSMASGSISIRADNPKSIVVFESWPSR